MDRQYITHKIKDFTKALTKELTTMDVLNDLLAWMSVSLFFFLSSLCNLACLGICLLAFMWAKLYVLPDDFSYCQNVDSQVSLPVMKSACLSVYLSVFVSVCLSVCVSVYLSVCLLLSNWIHLPVYLSFSESFTWFFCPSLISHTWNGFIWSLLLLCVGLFSNHVSCWSCQQ